MRFALVGEDEKAKAFYEEQFTKYIEQLQARLKRYDLKLTWKRRLGWWIKSHKILSIIIVGIPFLAGVIYLMEFFGFFK